MRSTFEIDYAIRSAEFTEAAATELDNHEAATIARALADALRWVKGESGTAFETFFETAQQTEVEN